MPDKAEYNAALSQIKSYADDFDVDLHDEIKQEHEDYGEVTHIVLEEDEQRFYISGLKEKEYFGVRYPFGVIGFISNGLSEEDAEQILKHHEVSKELQESEDETRAAAWALIKDADREKLGRLADELTMMTSAGLTRVEIQRENEVPFTGFELTTFMFPYESDFNLRRFGNAIQRITSVGLRASKVVQTSILLVDPDETDAETDEFKLDIDSSV
ncbi:hypothetical protein [Salinirussus salinus]|uniref:hypothetical protein n=1 Tax=Salinirussus salinus TaxID=1198300 RepID=UPI00135A9C36|nr:hypothetical protein [Salinirussus salinus]